jgi:LCP family protein required for cell wall assembly
MRTTLKRGAGRPQENGGAPPTSSGNGLGSGPLGPINRYAVWHRSGARLAGKIVLWTLAVLVVAAGALGGGIWLYLNESVVAIRATDPDVKAAEEILDQPVPGQPTTAIIIGYDKRVGIQGDPGRSDTLMLLRANPANDTLSLLSFPRDLTVEIPECGGRPATVDRINAAYAYCGTSGAVKTVKQLTGVPINYVLVVNFRAFKQIVNKVGGVYIDVDRRYFNDNSAYGDNYAKINLQPGYQKLTGGAALDYARFRHTDSDLHRIARQQQFIKAFKQQVQSNFSVLKLPGIINTITDNLQVGRGGKKNLDVDTVLGYARFLYELPSGNFYQAKIDGLTGFAELEAAPGSIQAAVREFLNPDTTAAEKATAAAAGKKPKPTAPAPSDVTIEVVNGNGVDGSASEAAAELSSRGYPAATGGNALDAQGNAKFDYFESAVVYDPAKAGSQAAARVVADLFGDAEVTPVPDGVEFDTLLRVIVGQTFQGSLAPAPVEHTPEHAPPDVERGNDAVLPLLREARRRVDFPVLVPTVFATGASLDSEVPVRAYSVNEHAAIKVTYERGSGSYYGIEETSWTDAPILSGANTTRRIGGRGYQLFYEGAKLHMVAFEENGAVYWVTNTLLDELSNETMLAIAKGLQPLSGLK